ncbi:hypothetical protein QOZ88_15480 [Blastococcus sp. BMG 814]|uniref:Alpha/beta hydrolase n=1 Tax=Blastococcus carthaginiensis TaxID=3050034 RepID=A0ABT9IEM4_9ACTN|nr:hypothetical protein [Blastococcus carthaginiensis]MDP5184039.1 hypothetical protein [Blastococcus carthaginiensis]
MTRTLVLVHGRAQEGKDPDRLKHEWLQALRGGLATQGLELPLSDGDIRFPYYGQTLASLVADPHAPAPGVVVKGRAGDRQEEEFVGDALREVARTAGVTEEQILDCADDVALERGATDAAWVQAVLRALDLHVPGVSAGSIATVTRDVYRYLRHPGVRDAIEEGVRRALAPDRPAVVVGHSLGSVVAYNLLRREGTSRGWQVPLLVTVGSPLAVSAVRSSLAPLRYPEVVSAWFNARDPRDLVALHPLDAARFPLDPAVEGFDGVVNTTANRHGITGYLSDPVVAVRIRAALLE